MTDFSFHRSERLKSRKTIGTLFEKGNTNTFNAYPVRFVWMPAENQAAPLQVAFSVSKKTFKRAHDRNLMKRRMREAFRLHKTSMNTAMEPTQKQFALMFIYNGKGELPYVDILKAYQNGARKWEKAMAEVAKT